MASVGQIIDELETLRDVANNLESNIKLIGVNARKQDLNAECLSCALELKMQAQKIASMTADYFDGEQ